MDLHQFFTSIKVFKVQKLFGSMGYSDFSSKVLANLCTTFPTRRSFSADGIKYVLHEGDKALPQGACTSPAISNLSCRNLDNRLYGWACKKGIAYSRYADDIFFSYDYCKQSIGELIGFISNVVTEEGFRVNHKKTRVMRNSSRQIVTGIVVNERPNIAKRQLKKFRSLIHYTEQSNLHEYVSEYASGMLSYIRMINPTRAKYFELRHDWLTKTKAKDLQKTDWSKGVYVRYHPKYGVYVFDSVLQPERHFGMGEFDPKWVVRWSCREAKLAILGGCDLKEATKEVRDPIIVGAAISQYVDKLRFKSEAFNRELREALDRRNALSG